ncbi:MAG TPA: molecular chaperone TorD family protein [Pyrinomonadaceae bacterium]|nr:molecular chaperone TorD family protein [Pyrinomonadaceae bacterium]
MELFRALAVLAEPPDRSEVARLARLLDLGDPPPLRDYTETFVFQLPPYASVYVGAEGMLGGEARDRVAGFLAALGRTPPAEPDHLVVLLATYAELAAPDCGATEGEEDARSVEGRRRARKAFLWEHLLSWLPAYLDKLAEVAPPFYGRWGELLLEALLEEAASVGAPASMPLHLREAPEMVDPRAATADEFLQSLLAPARSGLILTRADLARGARSLGAGLRAGERKFALKSLLGQDAEGALAWLAGEASAWAERHARRRDTLGAVAEWWRQRAEATAALLEELNAEGGAP